MISEENQNQCLERESIALGASTNLEIQLKMDHGVEMIDLRIWVRFPGKTEYTPLKKGIYLKASMFKEQVLPSIYKVLGTANTTEKG